MYVSFVYGDNRVKERLSLWDNLNDHKIVVGTYPWVMLGDFNSTLHNNENSNGLNVKNVLGMQEFRECMRNLNMEDINSCGLFFTWIQKRNDPREGILNKLDRVMGNDVFVSLYPERSAKFLPLLSSDHTPAILMLHDVKIKRKQGRAFRFMNYLTEKKGFLELIESHWKINVKGFDMYVLAKRLKAMKWHLRKLNKDNGNVFDNSNFLEWS